MHADQKVIFAADLAKILGWPTRRANRWMQSMGFGVKWGNRWITTPEMLRAHFPELWQIVMLELDE